MAAKSATVFSAALLVSGTCIGGGMLALPVLTGLAGFVPSLLIYFLCWAFMACTALLFLEVSFWMDKDANIISMSEKTLGRPGKIFSWVLYLFLFYCLCVAYIVGCGNLLAQVSFQMIPDWLAPSLFVLIFAPFIFLGAKVVGKINVFLMFGLALSFLLFVVLGFQFVDASLLEHRAWSYSLSALPIAFISFAFQGIIPTLVGYLHHDVKRIRMAILIGSFISLFTYVIWQWLIQGIVPVEGPGGLAETLANQQNAVQPLKNFINNPFIYTIGQFFAFFALVTSFFGVALGLMDFLADGLKIEKTWQGKSLLCLLIFIPPLCIASIYPHIFLSALEYAGGYGSALLLGLLPILMVWSGRYHLNLASTYRFPGGKAALLLLASFVLFELFCEIRLTFAVW